MSMRVSPRRLGLFVLAVAIVSGASAQRLRKVPAPTQVEQMPASYRGGLVVPPLPKPRFTLTDTSGAPFDFWSNTQGVVTLLFFGYTSCPDECPLHVENVRLGLDKLPASARARVQMVFVTTDPDRDTPQQLRAWLDRFDKRFIGLTGSEAEVEAAQREAGVPVARKAVRDGRAYSVGHANFVLAYTRDNLAHVIYPGGVVQQDWAHDLPQLLNETWSSR